MKISIGRKKFVLNQCSHKIDSKREKDLLELILKRVVNTENYELATLIYNRLEALKIEAIGMQFQ